MKFLKHTLVLAGVSLVLVGCGKNNLFGQSSAPIIDGTQTAGRSSQTFGVASSSQFNGQSFGGSQTASANTPTTVYFGFNQYTLSAKGRRIADQNAEYLLKNPNAHAVISGNTDPRGSQEYNFHLGQRRANALQQYLLSRGVASNQLCTLSYGELKPAGTPAEYGGDSAKAYRMDRRAVIEYNKTCQGKGTHA